MTPGETNSIGGTKKIQQTPKHVKATRKIIELMHCVSRLEGLQEQIQNGQPAPTGAPTDMKVDENMSIAEFLDHLEEIIEKLEDRINIATERIKEAILGG